MNLLKSHFWYTKSQRNGIFILAIIIIILQVIIVFGNFSLNETISLNTPEILDFQQQIDSLKASKNQKKQHKIYPFNPNYITDYKAEQLGMSLVEIDRLLKFRETNQFVNSKTDFQKVTKVSDTLLNKIAPYFKFPDWVVKNNQSKKSPNMMQHNSKKFFDEKPHHTLTTGDINKATALDLQTVNGIGPAFSDRIIKYRSKLQGFSYHQQLYEVWGLEKEVADKVLAIFKIIEKPITIKVNLNTVTFKELLKNPYIDYNLCKKIFEYRDEVAEIQNINELKNIKGFPLEKYDRIVLYLEAK